MATITGRSYVKAQSDFWADFSLTVTESSTSTANNTSTISYSFWAKQRPSSEFTYIGTTRDPGGKIVVTINGVDVKTANIAFVYRSEGSCSGSGTVTVPHNADGTKTLSYSIKMVEVAGNYSGDTWKYGAASKSGSMTLTKIPRASSISVSSGSGTKPGNGSIALSISRASSSFTHTVNWSCSGLSGTVATNVGTSTSWSVPLSIIEKSPNANSTVTFTCITYSGSTQVGSKTCTATVGHHTASTVSSHTTSAVCNGTNTINVNISRGNSNLVHTVTWHFGTNEYTKTKQTTSSSYAPPTSWLSAILAATKGTGGVTVKTFYNTTQIGSTVTVNFTLTVPEYTPNLTSVSVTRVQPSTISSWNVYIQNNSQAEFTFNGVSSSYGATIKQYAIAIGDLTLTSTTNTIQTPKLTASGTFSYTATITDSRNKTKSVTGSIDVEALITPTLTSSDVSRYNGSDKDDDGTQLYFNVVFSYGSYGGLNSTTNEIYIKQSIYKKYSKYGTFTSGTPLIISDYTFEMDAAYDVKVVVTDTIGNKLEQIFTINASYAIIDISDTGHGIGLLTMSSRDDYVEIGGHIHSFGNVEADGYVKPKQGLYIYDAYGIYPEPGYAKIAQITITKEYCDQPIAISFVRRLDNSVSNITIRFNGQNTVDPTLSTFTVDSVIKAYLHKSGTSIWDLYVEKSSGYDRISILSYYAGLYQRERLELRWIDYEQVTDLPEGYVSSTRVGIGHFVSLKIGPDKTSSVDGKPGVTIGNGGVIEITDTIPYIDFHSKNSTADYTSRIMDNGDRLYIIGGKNIRIQSGTNSWEFTQDITANSDYTEDTGFAVYYADSKDHYIVSRASNGLTSYFGWAGSSTYGTVSNIRGRQVTFNVAGTTYYASNISSSDMNLKYNIEYLSDDRYDMFYDKLKPSSYKMYIPEDGNRTRIGITGQDVELAMNESGLGFNDFYGLEIKNLSEMVEDTNEKNFLLEKGLDKYYFVNYQEFIMLNLSQIQKLKKRVSELEKLLGGNDNAN